jgi:flagellar assembly protein FliH
MPAKPLSPIQVSELIDNLLESKDTASVSLRRILKRKTEDSDAFPIKKMNLEQFESSGGLPGGFEKDEIEILKSQKQLAETMHVMQVEKENAAVEIKNAYNKGLTEGEALGRKAAQEEAEQRYNARLSEIETRIAGILTSVNEAKNRFLARASGTAADLAMLVAKKVVSHEISVNPDIILSVIKKAMTFVTDREKIVVRVNTADLETVTGKKEFWASIGEKLEGIKIEPDVRIQKGGCIIESASGAADSRIEVLFDGIRNVIDDTWHSISAGSQTEPTNCGPEDIRSASLPE